MMKPTTLLRPRLNSGPNRAFTLLEALIVVSILVILAALLMPALDRMKASADKAACANNLRLIGAGVTSYVGEHNGKIPAIKELTLNGWLQEIFADSITTTGVQSSTSYGAAYPHGPVFKLWICPGDPTRGQWQFRGAANGVPGTNENDTGVNAHSYSPNGWVLNRKMASIARPGQTILMADFQWGVNGTRFILPASSPWKDCFPLKWHNSYINCLFVDGHVEPLLAKTIIWGGSNSKLWYSDYPSSGTTFPSQND